MTTLKGISFAKTIYILYYSDYVKEDTSTYHIQSRSFVAKMWYILVLIYMCRRPRYECWKSILTSASHSLQYAIKRHQSSKNERIFITNKVYAINQRLNNVSCSLFFFSLLSIVTYVQFSRELKLYHDLWNIRSMN